MNRSLRYTAVIRLRKGKRIVYRESKTFSLRSAAVKMHDIFGCAIHPARRRTEICRLAWAIAERQSRKTGLVFPCEPRRVGAPFTRACNLLAIDDQRFDDLRHEATRRLTQTR